MVRRSFHRGWRAVLTAAVPLLLVGCAPGAAGPSPAASVVPAAASSAGGPLRFAMPKDPSGHAAATVKRWNDANPDRPVTLVELPDALDEQHAALVEAARNPDAPAFDVVSLDIVWVPEFAARGWLTELPREPLDVSAHLPVAVRAGSYEGKLYALPATVDAALLYYRRDLLDAAGITASPATWEQVRAACAAVIAKNRGVACYGSQLQQYEGLTFAVTEAVASAGGEILTPEGRPAVTTPAALAGIGWLAQSVTDGTIPAGALTWKEEVSRREFQAGRLVFVRHWPYISGMLEEPGSPVAGKVDVAELPGLSGPGVAALDGRSLGIPSRSSHRASAVAFLAWWNSAENQRAAMLATGNAPSRRALHADPSLVAEFRYLPVLAAALERATLRPQVVDYAKASRAVQDAGHAAITGATDARSAVGGLADALAALVP